MRMPKQKIDQIRIAFDGDAVLFSAESEKIFQKNGIQAFEEHEKANANTPMAKGPFANFLTKLSYVQQLFKEKDIQPIRTALVTSRNARHMNVQSKHSATGAYQSMKRSS